MKTIAFDFDGLITDNTRSFPLISPLRPFAKDVINLLYDKGHFIIIWTCREEDEVKTFLNQNGVFFHTINQNNPALIDLYGTDPRKVGADLYLDDKTLDFFHIDIDWLQFYERFCDLGYLSTSCQHFS